MSAKTFVARIELPADRIDVSIQQPTAQGVQNREGAALFTLADTFTVAEGDDLTLQVVCESDIFIDENVIVNLATVPDPDCVNNCAVPGVDYVNTAFQAVFEPVNGVISAGSLSSPFTITTKQNIASVDDLVFNIEVSNYLPSIIDYNPLSFFTSQILIENTGTRPEVTAYNCARPFVYDVFTGKITLKFAIVNFFAPQLGFFLEVLQDLTSCFSSNEQLDYDAFQGVTSFDVTDGIALLGGPELVDITLPLTVRATGKTSGLSSSFEVDIGIDMNVGTTVAKSRQQPPQITVMDYFIMQVNEVDEMFYDDRCRKLDSYNGRIDLITSINCCFVQTIDSDATLDVDLCFLYPPLQPFVDYDIQVKLRAMKAGSANVCVGTQLQDEQNQCFPIHTYAPLVMNTIPDQYIQLSAGRWAFKANPMVRGIDGREGVTIVATKADGGDIDYTYDSSDGSVTVRGSSTGTFGVNLIASDIAPQNGIETSQGVSFTIYVF